MRGVVRQSYCPRPNPSVLTAPAFLNTVSAPSPPSTRDPFSVVRRQSVRTDTLIRSNGYTPLVRRETRPQWNKSQHGYTGMYSTTIRSATFITLKPAPPSLREMWRLSHIHPHRLNCTLEHILHSNYLHLCLFYHIFIFIAAVL